MWNMVKTVGKWVGIAAVGAAGAIGTMLLQNAVKANKANKEIEDKNADAIDVAFEEVEPEEDKEEEG